MRTVAVGERTKASSGLSDVQKSPIPDCWACAPEHLTLQLSCVCTGHLHSTWEVGLMQPDVVNWLCKCSRGLGPVFICSPPDKKMTKSPS